MQAPEQVTDQASERPHWTRRLRGMWHSLRNSMTWVVIARHKWWWLAGALTGVTATVVMNMALSATARLIDAGVIDQTEPIGPLFVRLAVLITLSAVLAYGLRMIISRVGIAMEYELRNWLYTGLHSLDPRRLDSMASGQMVTRAMTDLNFLLMFIVFLPLLTVQIMVDVLPRAVWLFMQNVPLSLIVIVGIPINLYLVRRMSSRMWGFSWLTLNKMAEVTTSFDETVRGIRVVKAFGREQEERSKLAEVASRTYGVAMARIRLLAKFDLMMKTVPNAVNVLLVIVGARLVVADGGVSLGVFIVYLEAARRFSRFAQTFDQIVNLYMWSKSGAGRVYELLGMLDAKASEPEAGSDVPEPSSGLRLAGASVDYDGYPAVRDLSVEVGYGDLVAITGPPRAGRSTIAQLAAGTLRPSDGLVELEGADMSALHPAQLRRAVVVVNEEPFLFARSIRENLSFGARGEDVTEGELDAALHAAGADEVIEKLPAGLDSVLADRGMNLSGGERQRIALARALVRPARVIVLDDALTAVNPAFEVEILQRVRRHAPDSAILVLTRRDSATAVADRLVELPAPADGAPPGPPQLELGPYGAMRDLPYDPKLIEIISKELPPGDECPSVPEDACNNSDRAPGVRSTLAPLIKPVALATGLVVGFTLLGMLPPYLYGMVTDALNARDVGRSDQLAAALAGFTVVFALWAYFMRIYRTKVQQSIQYLLRRRIVHRITRLGVDYYDRESPGYMATRVVNDVDKIGEFVDNAVYKSVTAILQFMVVFTIMILWSPPVALVALAAAPVLVILSLWLVPVVARAYERVRREIGEVVARLQEDFMGRQELHAYSLRTKALEDFDVRARRLRRARLWSAIVSNGYAQLVDFVIQFASAVLLWVAGVQVLAAAITLGALATLRQYLDQVLDPLPELANVLEQYLEARASMRKVREPFDAEIRPPERPQPATTAGAVPGGPGDGGMLRIDGEIVLDDVTFAYPNTERPVLQDVRLEIAAGEMVAIVGPTGAGKSSTAKLIARTYDPDEGRVLIGGADLRDIDYTDYRQRLGYVPQETFLFRGTVKSNIAYGRPDATDAEIEEAARQVGAYEAIRSIPGALYGLVEEEARNLTSAQRQLIALVRAWLVDPDILVLDEATAVLDERMEQEVIDAVRELGRTTILITHRLHVAAGADRIVVVDGGSIVEDGTHDELLALDGVYAGLWAYGGEVDDRSMAKTKGSSRRSPSKKAAKRPARAKASAGGKGEPNGAAHGKRKRVAPKAASSRASGSTGKASTGQAGAAKASNGKAGAAKRATGRKGASTRTRRGDG